MRLSGLRGVALSINVRPYSRHSVPSDSPYTRVNTREAVRFLLHPPFPLLARPTYNVIASAAVSLLPGYARRMLWLPVLPGVEPLMVRPVATALMRTLGWALVRR